MSRFLALSALLLTLTSTGASAQYVARGVLLTPVVTPVVAVEPAQRPSSFQFSLGAGIASSFSSLHDDLVRANGDQYEDSPDAFSVSGTMTLSALAFHRQYNSGTQISLLAGYRASVDSYLVGLLDTGFIHRHEASFGLGINRRVVLSLGGGAAILHDEGETLPGGAAHIDLRWGLSSGMYFGVPVNISVFSGDADTVVLSTIAIEVGWQSLR